MSAVPPTFNFDYTRGIQKVLAEQLVVDLAIDGNFGPTSQAYLRQFQLKKGLAGDGLYGPATQAVVEPLIKAKYILTPDYQRDATELGVKLIAFKAICETEAGGAGFLYTGKPKILFERHIFYRCLQQALKANPVKFNQLVAANSDIISTVPGGYSPTSVGEWSRYGRALAIDANSANLATSWGLFQILGENYSFCGFSDVGSYVTAMQTTEMAQLEAATQFIIRYVSGQLKTALAQMNWAQFAKLYNGPANVLAYSSKMSSNYTLMEGIFGNI